MLIQGNFFYGYRVLHPSKVISWKCVMSDDLMVCLLAEV